MVGGSYFQVMGLSPARPPVGRDRRWAAGAGRGGADLSLLDDRVSTRPVGPRESIRLSDRTAVIVGVLEPSVPYPTETEIIANVVTSPHHLDATMVDGRPLRIAWQNSSAVSHRALNWSRPSGLKAVHGAVIQALRGLPSNADFRIDARRLRDRIIAGENHPADYFAASGLVFIVACSNVANLILARSVRREGELAVRAALGASAGALRHALLAESLLLCGAGAILAILVARPMVAVLGRYAARFSIRALDVTVDASLLWVGTRPGDRGRRPLAFVPRLPSAESANGLGLSTRQRA